MDLVLDLGCSFERKLQWLQADKTPVDLTGYTAAAQIRDDYDGSLVAQMTVTLGEDGQITLGVDTSSIDTSKLSLLGQLSEKLLSGDTITGSGYICVWDLLVTVGDHTDKLVGGRICLSKTVTHE